MGDLKGDPRVWMERYFDAHLYLASWGSHRVALRLPRAALDPATAARYCAVEPPVPAGLGELSDLQRALADFLRLDPDLLAAAAGASEPLAVKPPQVARWVKALPPKDKDELLLRVLRGEGAWVRSEMMRQVDQPTNSARTVGELLAAAAKLGVRRQQAKRRRESADRLRREKEEAAAQAERLRCWHVTRRRRGTRWTR